jgi:hypothetical protein
VSADHGKAPDSELGFEAYGVAVRLDVSPIELRSRVHSLLPPGWSPSPRTASAQRFALTAIADAYQVSRGTARVLSTPDLEVALGFLDAQIRAHIAFNAPDHIFVHAAVLAYDEMAIVIPGRSFTGKTTLAAALVRAGATYYSDEFAVLDTRGLVHPYPRPLSIRVPGSFDSSDHAAETLGGRVGVDPIAAGLIAVTRFRPGARWQPGRKRPADGALALLANTIPARARPAQALAATANASAHAIVLEGDRGEATAIARAIIGDLEDGLCAAG